MVTWVQTNWPLIETTVAAVFTSIGTTWTGTLQPALADADDVLQETFLTVSRKASSFEPGTNFVAWACGIARLKVLENFRQKKRTNVLSEAAIIALADESPASDLTGLREEALSRCLEKLAPKSRELLWRRYSVGRTRTRWPRDWV